MPLLPTLGPVSSYPSVSSSQHQRTDSGQLSLIHLIIYPISCPNELRPTPVFHLIILFTRWHVGQWAPPPTLSAGRSTEPSSGPGPANHLLTSPARPTGRLLTGRPETNLCMQCSDEDRMSFAIRRSSCNETYRSYGIQCLA